MWEVCGRERVHSKPDAPMKCLRPTRVVGITIMIVTWRQKIWKLLRPEKLVQRVKSEESVEGGEGA
eukprot:351544-Chlamydomonas_euryale.AAC.3